MSEERLVTRSLPCPMAELAALRRIITSGQASYFTSSVELKPFEVAMPDDLGKVQVALDQQYLVLWFREMSAPIRSQKPMAWLNTPMDQFVSPSFAQNARVAEGIRQLLKRPLWHFVAEQGRRISCVFCNRTLTILSSRALGYGPDCASKLRLFWFNS